ncbi:WAS/WASL-interacting protein family member 1-like [Nannospalax galili]|uniref:WAS/WASL-interacting protein family member 1-like n=1 Tax=Nannospalax galili TaxID=1026970 RepID=UPI00111C9118|nr:WAS/WASL-interacting protein family member 1-like [Nannospalax galili]
MVFATAPSNRHRHTWEFSISFITRKQLLKSLTMVILCPSAPAARASGQDELKERSEAVQSSRDLSPNSLKTHAATGSVNQLDQGPGSEQPLGTRLCQLGPVNSALPASHPSSGQERALGRGPGEGPGPSRPGQRHHAPIGRGRRIPRGDSGAVPGRCESKAPPPTRECRVRGAPVPGLRPSVRPSGHRRWGAGDASLPSDPPAAAVRCSSSRTIVSVAPRPRQRRRHRSAPPPPPEPPRAARWESSAEPARVHPATSGSSQPSRVPPAPRRRQSAPLPRSPRRSRAPSCGAHMDQSVPPPSREWEPGPGRVGKGPPRGAGLRVREGHPLAWAANALKPGDRTKFPERPALEEKQETLLSFAALSCLTLYHSSLETNQGLEHRAAEESRRKKLTGLTQRNHKCFRR